LEKADIIADVIDDFMPKCFVVPFYCKKKQPVALGNILKPSTTEESPSLKIYCPELHEKSGFTIVLTDPDAPSRKNPKWSEMCHWVGIVPVEDQLPVDFEFTISGKGHEVVECERLILLQLGSC
jgi:hypothetical protein